MLIGCQRRPRTGLIVSGMLLVALTIAISTLPPAAFAANPHVPASVTAASCPQCHDPHEAAVGENILKASGSIEGEPDPVKFCYACHDGSSAVNVKNGMNNAAFDNVSGHSVEAVGGTGADLTDVCASCHDPHADSTTRFRLAKEIITVTLPDNSTVDRNVDGADNTWCFACHDAQHSWWVSVDRATRSTTAYSNLIAKPSRNTTGYPLAGTFPGETAYAGSGHAGIPAAGVTDWVMPSREATRVAGDCLWCHSAHRGDNEHDGLVASFSGSSAEDVAGGAHPGRYAQACFECHGNSTGAVYKPAGEFGDAYWQDTVGAPDIYSRVTEDSERAGHRIKTASGALYEQGSPLPCYECHNPHGSKNGNTVMISDALGGNLHPDGTAEQVRQFCFSCHVTGDATPVGWDSDANDDGAHTDGTYTATLINTATGDSVAGISRTTEPPVSYLRLTTSAYHLQGSALSCYNCHGDVHRPTGGVSDGGLACYGCHRSDTASLDYEKNMEYDGANKGDNYHHVMGTPTTSGDSAFTSSTYPAAGTDVYCLSCHVDHDKFNSSKSSSLRSSIGSAPSGATASNTDFSATSGGVCLGCHYVSRTKDPNNRKSDGTSATPAIPYTSANAVDAGTVYGASEHRYQVAGRQRGDGTTFGGDCSKCHSDRLTGMYFKTATTGPEFGLHYDPSRRILEALGRGSVPDPYAEERFCYSCHSVAGSAPSGDGFKTTIDRDWYGDADGSMDGPSQAIYGEISANSAPWKTTSEDVLYFKTSAEGAVSGNQPTGDHSGDIYEPSTWLTRSMSPSPSSATAENYDTANVTTVVGRFYRRVRFVSPAVASQVTVPVNSSWRVDAYAREGNGNQNAYMRPYIYIWRADNSTKVAVAGPGNDTTEFTNNATPGLYSHTLANSGGAVTLQPGDKLVVDLAVYTNGAATGPLTYRWGLGYQGFLDAPVDIAWATPAGSAHSVDSYTGAHRPDESQDDISANKHVECQDCHNAHAAGATLNVWAGANTNRVGTGSPLLGVSGQTPAYPPATWPNTSSLTSRWVAPDPNGYTAASPSTYEYQICFKCHSSANKNLNSNVTGPAWDSTWTNVALEFNTDNASYHPVMGPTKQRTGYTRLNTWMRDPWNRTTANNGIYRQTMNCSDCHGSSASSPAAQGPHGSAVKHLLVGTWPTKNSDGSGVIGSADMWSLDDGTAPRYTGMLCDKCHNMDVLDTAFGAHSSHDTDSRDDCVYCHVTVPHGAGLYGLLGDGGTRTSSAVGQSEMPERYAYQGNKANLMLRAYGGNPGDQGSCQDSTAYTGCNHHSGDVGLWNW